MKVWISVHGRFHAFDLARELHRHGALAGIATTYPKTVAARYLPAGVSIRAAPWLEFYRRFGDKMSMSTDHLIAAAFGRFASQNLDATTDIFVGWSGASLEAIRVAHDRGMKVILERGSTHIEHQAAVLQAARRDLGISGLPIDPRMIDRELQEYEMADAISVPSRFAAATFERFGTPSRRLLVNPYGSDLRRFTPGSLKTGRRHPRIVFVGTLGVRKGVPTLLQAFANLRSGAELHLVGPIDPSLRNWLRSRESASITLCGPLRSPDLERAYAAADIFCLPSLEEGFPLAMLQAMAAGLPIVVTPETGAMDIIVDGREGLIVPSSDVDALSQALERLVSDESERTSMGEAARTRIAMGFSWEDYGNRAVAAYRAVFH